MCKPIALLGKNTLQYCQHLGRFGIFLYRLLAHRPQPVKMTPLVIVEIYNVGFLSLVIIVISGAFIGMVVGLQGYNILTKFSAEQELGQLIALSVTRELGPVVTALLFAGRAGSALTAEIGLMKTTEQLDSMDMIGVDPIHRLISPRFFAGFISMPLLTLIFSIVAILGGYIVGVEWLSVDSGAFWSNMQSSVNFRIDVLNGVIKSVVFGIVVTWIALYQGYYTTPTVDGISRATTRTVVFSSLAILGLDFVLTATMLGGW